VEVNAVEIIPGLLGRDRELRPVDQVAELLRPKVPGSPEKSDVIKMIKWTYDDEDYFMPPKKEKKLSAEQVAIIEEWIKRGMPWAK
jgi:hypothetical protein